MRGHTLDIDILVVVWAPEFKEDVASRAASPDISGSSLLV